MPEYKSSSPLARSLGLHLICLIYPQPFVVEAEDQGLLDMILSVCQTQESFHQSVFKPLTVSRTGLRKLLQRVGCLLNLVNIFTSLHGRMTAIDRSYVSAPFSELVIYNDSIANSSARSLC